MTIFDYDMLSEPGIMQVFRGVLRINTYTSYMHPSYSKSHLSYSNRNFELLRAELQREVQLLVCVEHDVIPLYTLKGKTQAVWTSSG